jgi:tripartite-type tricarboxylate transporter receptor subunit TctC
VALRDVRDRLTNAGLEVVGSSPEQFAARIRDEIVRKGALIRASGAKAN